MSYIAATNITYDVPNENPNTMRRLGKYGFSGNATLPAGNAGCVVSNVGLVTDLSMIFITPWQVGEPLNELKYATDGSLVRVTGDNGSFTIVTSNTLTNGADQKFGFMVVNP